MIAPLPTKFISTTSASSSSKCSKFESYLKVHVSESSKRLRYSR